MFRMCCIIYNGGQSIQHVSTRGVSTTMASKRTSYTAAFKLKVIETAEKCGNRATGREYSVNEKLVRDWRKKKAELEHYRDGTLQYEAFVCSRCHLSW